MVGYDLLVHGDTSASVAVMIEGDLVHASGFGVRVAGTFDPTEPVDRFRIASVSKVITATVTLQLVEDGLLAIDEPVGERVASYLGVTPTATAAQITVEQLLSHTSGFGTFYATFFQGGATSCPDAARQGLTSGTSAGGYHYSNMNFCVLGMLIEAVTGVPYEQAVYERLLTPLGITGMRLASTFDVGPDEVLHESEPGRTYMETLGGAGSWLATPSDIARIVDSLNPGGTGWKPLERRDGDPHAPRSVQHLGRVRGIRARSLQLPGWVVRAHRHDREHTRDGGQPPGSHHVGADGQRRIPGQHQRPQGDRRPRPRRRLRLKLPSDQLTWRSRPSQNGARSLNFWSLPVAVRASSVAELDALGALVAGELRAWPRRSTSSSVSVAAGRLDDERGHQLAPLLVGDADHGDLGDVGVLEDRVLDLDRRHVLAAGDDDVLLAVGDRDVVDRRRSSRRRRCGTSRRRSPSAVASGWSQ